MKRAIPLIIAALSFSFAAAEEPLHVFSGDGMTVKVYFEDEESGEVGGEIHLGNAVHPFTGVAEDDGTVEGNLIIGGRSQAFEATVQDLTSVLATGGKIYRLKKGGMPVVPAEPVEPAKPAAALPAMSLKRFELRDVTMGGVVSHTMLIPADWKAEGHVEWSKDGTAWPQMILKVTGPGHERITAVPAMNFSYTESKGRQMPPQGDAPPQELGAWIAGLVRRTNREVSEVRLIGDRRDVAAEEAQVKQKREQGINTPGMISQMHVVTLGYRRNGVAIREEIDVNYVRFPANDNIHLRSQGWALYPGRMVAAPEAEFERLRPQLYAIVGTCRPVPKWWNQMMQVRGEIMRAKSDRIFEEIRRRGEMYDRISDEQFAAWKQANARDNETQRRRIQGIYEVQDYRDRDGNAVELPFHHKHVFSDGQGNYLLTNDTNATPGSGFEEIHSAR